MGAAKSKLSQKGIQSLKNLKTKVDNLPEEGITQEQLDDFLNNTPLRPKTDAFLKHAKEQIEKSKGPDGVSTDATLNYVQQKDTEFLEKLGVSQEKLASEHVMKEQLPFTSEGVLPVDRTHSSYVTPHVPGKLTGDEMKELFNSPVMLSSIEGQHDLAKQFGISPQQMDELVQYVAMPVLEKRREETTELDAVWPSWKKELF